MTHSRRDTLKLLGAGAAAAMAPSRGSVILDPEGTLERKYFRLQDVRLGA